MKLLLMVLVAGSCALAQHGGSGHGGSAGRSGGVRGSGHYFAPPPVAHPVHAPAVIVPYPVYYGGYYYYATPGYYDTSAGGPPPAPAGNDYYDDTGAYGAPGQSPVVIVNQNYQPDSVNPVLRDYPNFPPDSRNPNAKSDDQPTITLIAMKDHTILAAIAYWVEGDTLAYITTDHDQNRISLALVDREFSSKLNADRGVEFRLPPAK